MITEDPDGFSELLEDSDLIDVTVLTPDYDRMMICALPYHSIYLHNKPRIRDDQWMYALSRIYWPQGRHND